jgi:hypothetical protein
MDLVRDLLDKRVIDRNGRDIGRVDSIVLEIRAGAQPRVAAIELGPAVLAYRVHPFLGRCMAALEHILGIDQGRPTRFPIGTILEFDPHIKVDAAVGETPAAALEQKLRRVVGRIPGAS